MIEIKKEDVTGITLISAEEARTLPKYILDIGTWWWLRSPGCNRKCAAAVYRSGSVDYYGPYVFSGSVAVRPALIIPNLKSLNLQIRDVVKVFDEEWFVISDSMVLLNGNLGHYRFDKESNNYETSEIKRFLEDWLKKQKIKMEYTEKIENENDLSAEDNDESEIFLLTRGAILVEVLKDYGIDCSHITAKIGEHLVEDLFQTLEMHGYVEREASNEE